MAFGKVGDMDVVAHAGAVGRRIVIAEHRQLVAPAHRHLGHVGHQVVGRAARVFADATALVSADRVEVAQGCGLPGRVGDAEVAQDLLAHQLGGAVGVGGRGRCILAQRQLLGGAVDRRARAEHHARAAVAPHHLAGVDQAAEVVAVVGQRLRDRLPDRLEGREMHDDGRPVAAKDLIQRSGVAHIGRFELDRRRGQFRQAVQDDGRAVGEVVDANHAEAGLLECEPGVGGDVAGGAGEQDGGHRGRSIQDGLARAAIAVGAVDVRRHAAVATGMVVLAAEHEATRQGPADAEVIGQVVFERIEHGRPRGAGAVVAVAVGTGG
mmetsp:Transcript_59436/g.140553  ORF Transcript_59436/g.140553 Transcript_59436/m.140553 type:complete len:323 (+) Transcript_59436:955-1923(+)